MGDPDSNLVVPEAVAEYRVRGALDALDEDISDLHSAVHKLEERTLRAISLQVKGYEDFRRFFLSLNFILLPVLIALGICFMQQHMSEATDPATKAALNSAVVFLLFVSGCVGVPLYLGALVAIYKFSTPNDVLSADLLRSFLLDYEVELDAMQSSSEFVTPRPSSETNLGHDDEQDSENIGEQNEDFVDFELQEENQGPHPDHDHED